MRCNRDSSPGSGDYAGTEITSKANAHSAHDCIDNWYVGSAFCIRTSGHGESQRRSNASKTFGIIPPVSFREVVWLPAHNTFKEGGPYPHNTRIISGSGKAFLGVGANIGVPTVSLDLDGYNIRIRTSNASASAAAAGNQGEIRWDSGFIYVCVAANTWKRVAITSW